MGNYIANADALVVYFPQARLIQLAADLSNQTTLADATVAANIAAAIASAEGEIDGRLASRMTVPVTPVPKRLELCAAHLTIYYLFQRKTEIGEFWEKQYQRETAWLDKVQASELGLGATTPNEHETIHTNADAYEADGSDRPMVFGGGGIDDFGSG